MSKHEFQTEVSQLLHLIIHSLYSHKEIFLRELISNSSDALDKLKYLTLTNDDFKKLDFQPRIDVSFNESTITISDTGIGMNEEDLVEHLGTIARSGTKNFLSQLSGDDRKDSSLIGQFGVGFYSVFMVADKVEVISRKAGEETAFKWTSDGKSGYNIEAAERDANGTTIIIHINDEGKEYTSKWSIEGIIKKYSNHIPFPIFLEHEKKEYDKEGKVKSTEMVKEQVNSASALWRRSKSEIKPEEYNDFYTTISGDSDEPLLHLHTKAEGTLEYTTLFYVPKKAPMDMYQMDFNPGVKLYVKRVFITDDEKELMPTYLRFLRGVIDSEDLPLNVSREILQQNRVLSNIKTASVKKVLGELEKLSTSNKEKYLEFVKEYNKPLKEGLYSDFANRETLLELIRFKSSTREGYISLQEYKDAMKEDQKAMYYVTGGDEQTLRNSPLLEAYNKKGIEVLIMDDDFDEIIIPSIGTYKEVELKAVNRSDAGEDLKDEKDTEKEKELEPVLKQLKDALGDRVKDVTFSVRLADSPSCIVIDENDPSVKMQAMLKAMGQMEVPEVKPILEVNPNNDIVASVKDNADSDYVNDVANLLLDQAMLVEGMALKNPADFVKRLNRVMKRAI